MFNYFSTMKYNFIKKGFFLLLFVITGPFSFSQDYWQQRANYQMQIKFDDKAHQFTGSQTLKYFNNSPDTLKKVYYHLYFNAFQPGSMMDVRSRTIEDPDSRIGSRIEKLDKSEIGYHKINSLTQNGQPLSFQVEGTVLEVQLAEPLLPRSQAIFEMTFNSQVPVQIRRSGRNSAEGIDYSMAQWFPKMAAYDERGWHAHPYIGREFYAPFGDYEVTITIDKKFILAGTGVLQNPNDIGYGYEEEGTRVKRKGKSLTWKFKAENVHDFVWTADPDYTHKKVNLENGPTLHFFYQAGDDTKEWEKLPSYTEKAMEFLQANVGPYPHPQFSVIQGGDGGMEYPMATLISGARDLGSLVGVTIHELSHNWFQGLFATNESYYGWMDEGMTEYFEELAKASIYNNTSYPHLRHFQVYAYLAKSGKEEPLSTHSDHYVTNTAYELGAYYKGAVAIAQMNYLVGPSVAAKAIRRYYRDWSFKHPDANDWLRTYEKESGLELDWYLDHWVNTTHFIDYGISEVAEESGKVNVTMERVGHMPMPMDVYVTFKDGTKKIYYAPLAIMRGEKINDSGLERVVLPDWQWTHPTYQFIIDAPLSSIQSIIIDETGYLADINRNNNRWDAK